tara:strand:- start:1613 stop:2350 length:738 start_codon:yes stop_codon:yes gene_type:complete
LRLFISSLIIFILSNAVRADTIYNLIKIPNLEVYKTDSSNGIKYLKANKPFQIGIGKDNVTCFNSNIENIKNKFNLLENNFNKYELNFLKKINLKYIVLCENLSVAGINSAGVPNHLMKTLILDINFDPINFERVIHHEIFHIINDSRKELFDEKEWIKFNNKDFKYAECSTCTDKLNLSLIKNTNGFLTEYSMTTPSEDMAEIYSFIITDNKLLKNKTDKDTILKNKVSYLKNQLLLIDKSLKF